MLNASQSAGAVEYGDCIFAVEYDLHPMSIVDT